MFKNAKYKTFGENMYNKKFYFIQIFYFIQFFYILSDYNPLFTFTHTHTHTHIYIYIYVDS